MARRRIQGQLRRVQDVPAHQPAFYLQGRRRRCSPATATSRSAPIRELAQLFGTLPQNAVRRAAGARRDRAVADDGVLRSGRARGRPARQHVREHLQARRRGRSGRWRRSRCTRPCPAITCRSRSRRSWTSCPSSARTSSYTAFVEGWALYAEILGDEMGFYEDPVLEVRPAHLRDVARRPARRRYRACTRWAGRASRRSTSSARTPPRPTQDITVEVDRYIVWPGQALGYKMGQLKIRELRANAERQLGAKFDVRAFHDVVLRRARCRSTSSKSVSTTGLPRRRSNNPSMSNPASPSARSCGSSGRGRSCYSRRSLTKYVMLI